MNILFGSVVVLMVIWTAVLTYIVIKHVNDESEDE